MSDKDVRLMPNEQAGSEQRMQDPSREIHADVRSTVESQFRQMEQAHDRIRVEELAARLADD
jgi:hypothetical protein